MKKVKFAFLATQVVSIFLGTLGCVQNDTLPNANAPQPDSYDSPPRVEIEMENGGKIQLELDRENAPITVENFLSLVSSGFYDGLTFHRIISGFMIQGGCPQGTGTAGSGTNIKGEFQANGVNNTIRHNRGVISMARSNDYNSASSQFFITHGDSRFLDENYAAFGTVTAGMDVVDRVASVPTDAGDRPLETVVIKSIRIID